MKLITKISGNIGYKNISEKRLCSVLSKPKFHNERLEKIREGLKKSKHKFSKSEIKEIRKKPLRNREQKKNLNIKNKRH